MTKMEQIDLAFAKELAKGTTQVEIVKSITKKIGCSHVTVRKSKHYIPQTEMTNFRKDLINTYISESTLLVRKDVLEEVVEKLKRNHNLTMSKGHVGVHFDRLNIHIITLNDFKNIIEEQVSRNPGNLQEAFRITRDIINAKSPKKYTSKSINNYWYKHMAHKTEVFRIVSKHQKLINIKNYQPTFTKISTIRKVVNYVKNLF